MAERNGERLVERVNRKDLTGLAGVLGYPLEQTDTGYALPWDDNELPPFAHWVNSNPPVAREKIGADGHLALGEFLPAIPFPRRMWAGSRVSIVKPYQPEQPLLHERTLHSIDYKQGRSGKLAFMQLQHRYFANGELVLSEQQDLVYRRAATVMAPAPHVKDERDIRATHDADWWLKVEPDPVMLFQFSAITYNGHRIHYDRRYAVEQELYPGLVVHGPLTASLLVDLYQRHNHDQRIETFSFRGVAPLYDTAPFYLAGIRSEQGAEMTAIGPDGHTALTVSISARPRLTGTGT